MFRSLTVAAGCAVALALPGTAIAANGSANPYLYEQGSSNPLNDQGSSPDYRSEITSVSPHVPGLQLQILQFSDRLELTNHTGKTITIYGYQKEPYARVMPNGTVQLNERSPAVYLNTNFYGQVTVPKSANPGDAPEWATVYKTGSFDWHDHRIHWMSPLLPPQVKGRQSQRTLIFSWTVPISVGAQRGDIAGQLFWVPQTSKASPVAYIALGVILALSLALIAVVRRRRTRTPGGPGAPGSGDDPPREPATTREAW